MATRFFLLFGLFSCFCTNLIAAKGDGTYSRIAITDFRIEVLNGLPVEDLNKIPAYRDSLLYSITRSLRTKYKAKEIVNWQRGGILMQRTPLRGTHLEYIAVQDYDAYVAISVSIRALNQSTPATSGYAMTCEVEGSNAKGKSFFYGKSKQRFLLARYDQFFRSSRADPDTFFKLLYNGLHGALRNSGKADGFASLPYEIEYKYNTFIKAAERHTLWESITPGESYINAYLRSGDENNIESFSAVAQERRPLSIRNVFGSELGSSIRRVEYFREHTLNLGNEEYLVQQNITEEVTAKRDTVYKNECYIFGRDKQSIGSFRRIMLGAIATTEGDFAGTRLSLNNNIGANAFEIGYGDTMQAVLQYRIRIGNYHAYLPSKSPVEMKKGIVLLWQMHRLLESMEAVYINNRKY